MQVKSMNENTTTDSNVVAKDTIHHIAVQVNDIRLAVDWYTEHYTCEIQYQDNSWAMLDFANMSLALVLPEQHPQHFAIVSDDISNYGKAVPHRDGTSSVYIKDIDGNHIEMMTLPVKTTINC
jgi:catechol 2,3-dioxygenase-like lactoylglutathione lyase family enzyme